MIFLVKLTSVYNRSNKINTYVDLDVSYEDALKVVRAYKAVTAYSGDKWYIDNDSDYRQVIYLLPDNTDLTVVKAIYDFIGKKKGFITPFEEWYTLNKEEILNGTYDPEEE